MTVHFLTGDCRDKLRTLDAGSVNTCITSVPYWGLRDYKIPPSVWGGDPECRHRWQDHIQPSANGSSLPMAGVTKNGASASRQPKHSGFCIRCNAWRGCYGLEPTYQLYVEHTVEIFSAVWRVLRPDGTLWLNIGDCYANSRAGWSAQRYMDEERDDRTFRDKPFNTFTTRKRASDANGRSTPGRAHGRIGNDGAYHGPDEQPNRQPQQGLKQKDLCGIPWRVAFALQDAGWWLRRDVIWHKKNPMPESTYDRPTTAHEYLFLFSKSGDTLCWRHQDGRWMFAKPEPDYRWRHRVTRLMTAIEPASGDKEWFRFNLWRGYDYYYDAYSIMEPSSPDSHARAARSRSKEHKHSNGSDLSGKPHGIAIGAPSAGRLLPTPAGWDEGDGHHGSVHRNGRRALPAHFKQGGPNSRFHKDRVPRERKADAHAGTFAGHDGPRPKNNANFDAHLGSADLVPMRNKRSVWSIATKPFKEAHFATFPPALIEPCILAGCPKGGTVLDPFAGAGTTGLVAELHGRNSILIEINAKYVAMAEQRIARELKMGPEQKKRHDIKQSGKLKPAKGLPLFKGLKAVTRDGAEEQHDGAA